MSWHFLRERAAASWEAPSLVGAPSALLNMLPTRVRSYLPARRTEYCQLSLFGMTCEPLTEGHGEDASTLSVAASRARISALLAAETDLMENVPDCGPSLPGSLARYNPNSRSWRTAQCSLQGDLTEFSRTFPRWGTMRNGELWERSTPALRTDVNASGSSPTPSGNWPTPCVADVFTDRLKSAQQVEGSMHSVNLSQAVHMWPTPRAEERQQHNSQDNGMALSLAVKMFPTPVSKSEKGGRMGLDGGSHARTALVRDHGQQAMKDLTGGQLNPDWVEWLMGWPIGWTDLNPLETDRFRMWPRSHGIPCLPASKDDELTRGTAAQQPPKT